jgi:acetyl esterase/lipase
MKNFFEQKKSIAVAVGMLALAATSSWAQELVPSYQNLAYGENERQVLDVWLPAVPTTSTACPCVIYIHGGGFTSGNKNAGGNQRSMILNCRERGWAYAALNYRYAKAGVRMIDSMTDGKVGLQFIRHRAKEWGIDASRIALYGDSAGTGMCLWIGLNDDMKDEFSDDAVLRESTRVSAIGMINGQITYDRTETTEIVFGGMNLPEHLKVVKPAPDRGPPVSMLNLITSDDPPVFVYSFWPDTPPEAFPHFGHHPRHGLELKRRYEGLGLRCQVRMARVENEHLHQAARAVGYAEMMDFFASVFEKQVMP